MWMCACVQSKVICTFASSLSVKRKRKLSCESIPLYYRWGELIRSVEGKENFCACAKNLCIITEWHRSVYLLNEILLRVTLKMACYYYLLVTVAAN